MDQVFSCADKLGFYPTGEYFQLNSYENRVFDLFLDPFQAPKDLNQRVICKIYRPHRWSLEAILQEHSFIYELKAEGIPAIAPMVLENQSTAFLHQGMIYSFFPRGLGRMPQELSLEDLRKVGFQLARLHNIGSKKKADQRLSLDVDYFGWQALDGLIDWVAPEVWNRYLKAGEMICDFLQERLDMENYIRIHGDCHRGNILQTDPRDGEKENFFVDFDDFINGPPVQDFWMLLSGPIENNREELDSLLSGY